jgi:hypothetical protein
MASYYVELPGGLSIADQSQAIRGEEAGGAQFLSSKIWTNSQNKLSNLAEFDELASAPIPPLGKPTFSLTLPSGTTPVWAGSMIVAGTAQHQVFLLRS